MPLRALVLALALTLATAIPAERARADSFPSALLDVSGLYTRVVDPALPQASIAFVTRQGIALTAYTYRASGFDPLTSPILFVMHGSNRDADHLLEHFKPIGERHDALVVAPEFPDSVYGPDSWPYTLGVGTDGLPGSSGFDPTEWRDPTDYIYSEVEHLFDAIRLELGGAQTGYRLFGHSAGAQFVHRLMTFRPDARVETAVAANAGWYTLPASGGPTDPNLRFPYGLFATPVSGDEIDELLAAPLVVLAGQFDTETAAEDPRLRDTPQANAQGLNRHERASHYMGFAESLAVARQVPFAWDHDVVPGAGHSTLEMAQSAGWYLFRDQEDAPCVPTPASDAAGLRITEIHADATAGSLGDASGDGLTGNDDFVELANIGSTPLCLDGWSMTDASRPVRHRFPLGSELGPGDIMVVFDRGIPTGSFAGSQVQWTAYSTLLSLSGSGDVLELRDASGVLAMSISWGDCADRPCASEHIPSSLSIEESVTRSPTPTSDFTRHSTASTGLYSPGRYLPEPNSTLARAFGALALVALAQRRQRSLAKRSSASHRNASGLPV